MTAARSAALAFPTRFALAIGLTAAADFLLFDHPPGVGLLLLLVLVGAGIFAANGGGRLSPLPVLLFAASLLPLAENVSALSGTLALSGCAVFALAASRRLRRGIDAVAGQVLRLGVAFPFRLAADFLAGRRAGQRAGKAGSRRGRLVAWALPLLLTAVFLALFAVANPVFEYWLSRLDLWVLLDLLEFRRIAFWVPVLAGVWTLLRPRMIPGNRRRAAKPPAAAGPEPAPRPAVLSGEFFGRAAVLRTLLILNALFAVETVLDAAYLWGGVALPDGLTYAGYAHRGAYPLVGTALLAAAIILLFMRRGSDTAADGRIRALVHLWTVQNIVLVFSSILRLDLYVGIYALTYWRVAAFVWMGLVAAGLALVLVRVAGNRGNRWLVRANLGVLALTLYACCFLDFAALIARFNVEHSREMGGEGEALDLSYLVSLGPGAIPAIDRTLAGGETADAAMRPSLETPRNVLAVGLRTRLEDWRGWTLRDWRLLRYLDGPTAVPAGPGPEQPRP